MKTPFSDIACDYLALSRGNFYAEKQHSNKVLPFGARGPVIMRHRVQTNSIAASNLLMVGSNLKQDRTKYEIFLSLSLFIFLYI